MLLRLLQFEWFFWTRKKSFYLLLILHAALGFLLASAARFPWPNTYRNSPYVITYVLGMLSLAAIFSTTFMTAQSLLREQDSRFDRILFAAPLHRFPYIASRFLTVFLLTALCFTFFTAGLAAGHASGSNQDSNGPFRLLYYAQPFLLLLLPNILLCTAVACCLGLTVRNKVLIYVSGILLYFLYWIIAIVTNSPLIANSAPPAAAALHRAALLDPFGIAAFLQQTQHWASGERNTQRLSFTGPLLINRLLYLALSAALLAIAYARFRFSIPADKEKKAGRSRPDDTTQYRYQAVNTYSHNTAYLLRCIRSQLGLEVSYLLKSAPLWITGLSWIAFFSIELCSKLDGNARIPPLIASTPVIVTEILSSWPLTGMLLTWFYSGTLLWRSKANRFDVLELTTPAPHFARLFSTWLALVLVIIVLLTGSILTGIIIQLLQPHSAPINGMLYGQLYYLCGLPMALYTALLLLLQVIVRNRYAGMALSGMVLLCTYPATGRMLGLRHPLPGYLRSFAGGYSDFNGFGIAMEAFHVRMLFGLAFTIALFTAWVLLRRQGQSHKTRPIVHRALPAVILLLSLAGSIGAGYILWSRTPGIRRQHMDDWKQGYEAHYRFLEYRAQPVVTHIKTHIDLYPERESMEISGSYSLVNKDTSVIDTIYINTVPEKVTWLSCSLQGGKLLWTDRRYGCSAFVPDRPMRPGDTAWLHFRFRYQASPYYPSDDFHQMLTNGSFSRISRYYPVAGYNSDNEIDDPRERAYRNMPTRNRSRLSENRDSSYYFVHVETTIATSADQVAIAIGTLRKRWQQQHRNYFYYVTEAPVPFRFAVASARYRIKRLQHGQVMIEAYFHPAHNRNIDHLLRSATEALDYGSSHIYPYPFRILRLVEISSFSKGFAGTAYPTTLFINEAFGYSNILHGDTGRDIIHEMVSHEIAHTWWGNAGIAPGEEEGNKLLTETLAMYTELMLYKKRYGESAILPRVNVHKDIYLASRGFSTEEPLFRSAPEKPYLCYDKGMVVMYQLYRLLGEDKVNRALQQLYRRFAYPAPRPQSTDLIDALYTVADAAQRRKIDEWFRQIVTYELGIDNTSLSRQSTGYQLSFYATAKRFEEDGRGKRTATAFNDQLEVAVYLPGGKEERLLLPLKDGHASAQYLFTAKPAKIVLDPRGLFLDVSGEAKECTLR